MAVRLSTGLVNALAGGGAGDGSFKDIFANAVIVIRTGTQPATADDAETGDVLGMITVNGGAFVAGVATNGLNWDAAVGGVCAKPSAEEWAIIPSASGTAGYGRLYANDMTTGASTTAIRMDLACGVGAGELRFSSTNLIATIKSIVNSLNITVPKS
jgi:hypothetical protein